jgi:hypothetical protein
MIDNKICFECSSIENIHMHHVVPKIYGGTKMIPLCAKCHGLVHSKDLTKLAVLGKAGRDRCKAEGKVYCGSIVYGLKRDSNNHKVLAICEEEMKVVRRMKNLRSRGWSYNKISLKLNEDGIKSKKGGVWYMRSVYNILKHYDINKKPASAKYLSHLNP